MNLTDACDELGVRWPAAHADVRAAYLKLLRIRKPDRDPAGFRRLRDAYELLLPLAPAEGAPAMPIDAPPASFSPAAHAAADHERTKSEPAHAERASLPSDAAHEDASGPEVPTAVDTATPDPELAAHFALFARLERHDHERTMALIKLFGSAASAPERPVPPVEVALDWVLELYAKLETENAARLLRATRQWMASAGTEREVLQHGLGRLWLAVREIDAVHAEIPPKLLPALARHYRIDNRSLTALDKVRTFAIGYESDARRLRAVLHGRTKLLASDFVALLDSQLAPAASAPKSSGFRPYWFILVAAMGLLRMCSTMTRDDAPRFPASSSGYSSPSR
jgi:hypothetical protein